MNTSKARLNFLHKRSVYEETQPFTPKENKTLSLQQKNYVRGIQIARNVSKKKAISLFKKSKKDSKLTKSLTRSIQKKYETGLSFREGKKPLPKIVDRKKKKKSKTKIKYKYAGKPQKASKKQIARFKSLGGTSRRYIDTHTGEEISRRERDKRL